eukprot:6952307-Alexandrium_andersonii.AAC.1
METKSFCGLFVGPPWHLRGSGPDSPDPGLRLPQPPGEVRDSDSLAIVQAFRHSSIFIYEGPRAVPLRHLPVLGLRLPRRSLRQGQPSQLDPFMSALHYVYF